MKKFLVMGMAMVGMLALPSVTSAQYRTDAKVETSAETQQILENAASSEVPVVITLDQALKIALSENVSVKVADMEIERTGYAKKGAYAALYPQIDASGAYQRTIKKQVMYMDIDMSSLGGLTGGGAAGGSGEGSGRCYHAGRNSDSRIRIIIFFIFIKQRRS